MTDPLSITAGVAGLVTLTLQLTKALKGYTVTAIHACKEVNSVIIELETTQSVLQQLQPFLEGPKAQVIVFKHESALQVAVERCEAVMKGLKNRLEKLDSSSRYVNVLERLKWPLKEDEVKGFLLNLGRCTAIFHFAMTIEGCKVLSQNNEIARASLEVQLIHSKQIVELSQKVVAMQHLAEEASRTSATLLSMVQLLQDEQLRELDFQELKLGVAVLTNHAHESKRQQMLDWLSKPHHAQKHHEIKKRRVAGTGRWLLHDEKFRSWRSGETPTLICVGGPGVGKSILSSLVVDQLEEDLQNNERIALAFYYFDYRTPDLQTPEAFATNILRQLLSNSSSVPKRFRDLYDRYHNSSALNHVKEIWSLLREALPTQQLVYLIIDAFDECFNSASRRNILKELDSLDKKRFRIFVASRPHCSELMAKAAEDNIIHISAHDEDVQAYIESAIDANDNAAEIFDDELKATCVKEIAAHAKGMFLLVLLQTQTILEAITKSEVRKHLKRLTEDLGEAFRQTLHRIDRQAPGRRIAAHRTLMWISRSFTTLMINDLCEILAVDIEEDVVDEEAVMSPRQVVESCLGLVYVDENTQEVKLVHLALQEFLSGEQLSVERDLDVDTYITSTLLTYLSFAHKAKREGKKLRHWWSLGVYALMHWGVHAKSAVASIVDPISLRYLEQSSSHYNNIKISRKIIDGSGSLKSSKNSRAPRLFPYRATALHVAAAFGLPRLIGRLLDDEIDIDAWDGERNTALHLAVANSHLKSTSLLLQRGARLGFENKRARSPLYEAVVTSNVPVIQELLRHDAPVNVECEDRWTPLHKAADIGDLTVVRILLGKRADVTSKSFRGLVALHRAAGKGNLEIMKELIDAGSPVDSQTIDGWSPLHGTCNAGHSEAARLLLSLGARINLIDVDGRTPLHRAARNGHAACIAILLENGADRLNQDYRGCTPLHRIAKGGHWGLIDRLQSKDHGINVKQLEIRNDENMTPREHAAHQGQWRTAQELKSMEELFKLRKPSEVTVVEQCVSVGNLADLKAVAPGADLAMMTSEGFSLFHLALIEEHEDVARYLSTHPSISLAATTSEGWHALHCAANTGNPDLVRLVLELKPEIGARTHIGEVALHKACRSGNLECVQLLIEAGARINVADSWGWTPLHKAALSGSMPLVQLLVERGAYISARTKKQATPQICANDAGHWEVSEYLRQLRQDGFRHVHRSASADRASVREVPQLLSIDADVEDLIKLSDPDQRLQSLRCDGCDTHEKDSHKTEPGNS